MSLLQVALDFTKLRDAMNVAKQVSRAGAHLIEAGTPLIKSCGVSCVRALSKFGKPVVADMKTVDTGYLEVEMAALNGASIVSVLGLAPKATIEQALRARDDYGIKLMVDLLGVKEMREKARELASMGVDFLLFHIGKDEQAKGVNVSDLLDVFESYGCKLAVAGGINKDTVGMFVGFADVIIVGSAIIKAKDPYKATKEILGEIRAKRKC